MFQTIQSKLCEVVIMLMESFGGKYWVNMFCGSMWWKISGGEFLVEDLMWKIKLLLENTWWKICVENFWLKMLLKKILADNFGGGKL